MIQTVSVSASAPAFTLLLYETLKNEFGQEGFLFGDIIERETKTITDNDQQQTYISKIIKVNSVLPCPKTCYFYNGAGQIDTDKLKLFIGSLQSKVIAWYKYKPISSFKLTLREKLVHQQLMEIFNEELLSVCLLISDSTPNGSTHSFQQTFLRYKNKRYEPLPFHIVNLTDKKNTYKSAEPQSESFQAIIDKLKLDPKTSQRVTFITRLQQSVQEHIETVVKELAEKEQELFELEREVATLMKNKEEKHDIITESLDEKVEDSENNQTDISNEMTEKNVKKERKRRKPTNVTKR